MSRVSLTARRGALSITTLPLSPSGSVRFVIRNHSDKLTELWLNCRPLLVLARIGFVISA